MKLHDQVCTVEQAKRLKELGIVQEAEFSWFVATDVDDDSALNRSWKSSCLTCGHPRTPYFDELSAFTASELSSALPDYFTVHRGHSGGYYCNKLMATDPEATGPTMAQAMASRLITGLETGELTSDEVNKRLTACQ